MNNNVKLTKTLIGEIIPKTINNTTMEILALIELISLSNSRLDTFYFEMKDTMDNKTTEVKDHENHNRQIQ